MNKRWDCIDCGQPLPSPTPDPFRCPSCLRHLVDCYQKRGGGASTMTAADAMHEVWGTLCPDCGPDDYVAIVEEVKRQTGNLPA